MVPPRSVSEAPLLRAETLNSLAAIYDRRGPPLGLVLDMQPSRLHSMKH